MSLQSLNQGMVKRHDSCVFSPDQVVSAILGQSSVVLNGFGADDVHQNLAMDIPNVSMLWLHDAREQEKVIFDHAKKRAARLRFLAGSVLVLAIFFGLIVGSVFGKLSVRGIGESAQSVRWQAVSVRNDGLELLVGERKIVIAVGSILPSGEILQAVDASRQMFTTPNQVVSVKNMGNTGLKK